MRGRLPKKICTRRKEKYREGGTKKKEIEMSMQRKKKIQREDISVRLGFLSSESSFSVPKVLLHVIPWFGRLIRKEFEKK